MLLAAWGAAGAQTRRDTAYTRNLPTVTVRGESSRTAASTAPKFTLDGNRLERIGATDIGQAMKRLPGVNLRDYGGAGGLKTVSVRGLGAAHTAVMLDGIALTNSRSGEIDLGRYAIDGLGAISLAIGDNDEIFQPARASASAATVSITTAPRPEYDSLHLTGIVRGGSFGYVSPYIKVSKGFADRYAVSIIADYNRSDNNYPFRLHNGNIVTTEKRNNSRVDAWHGEINFTSRLRPGTTLLSKVYYYDSDRKLPGPVIYYNDINREALREHTAFWQSTLRSSLGHGFSLLANAKFNWDASRYSDVNGKYPGGRIDQNYYQREAYASGALLWLPTTNWSIDYSADYAFNNLSSNLKTENHPWRHTILQSLSARFKTSRVTATARLLGSIYRNGSRDGTAARNASRLSPSVSVSVRPFASQNLFVRASYKNIFRMPTFNESYFFHYGSPTLSPETTDQFNIGVTWQTAPAAWLPNLTITADGYVNHVKDKIVAVPYNMFVWTVVNLDKVRGLGADITLSADFVPARGHSLLFAANYSYQRVEPRIPGSRDFGRQVAYIPLNSGGASASYENPWLNLTFSATGTSARYATNENLAGTRIAGYIEAGLSFYRSFRVGRCSIEPKFDIINLFDKNYAVIARYPMPGRSYRAGIKIEL